jgi:hypothetical protein
MMFAVVGVLATLWFGASAGDPRMSCEPSFRTIAAQLARNPSMTHDAATPARPWHIYRTPAAQRWPRAEVRVSAPGADAHPAVIRMLQGDDGEARSVAICCWADALSCRRLAADQGVQIQRSRR